MNYTVKLIGKRMVAEGIGEFKFEKPVDFKYLPGQFVQFRIPNEDKTVVRSYSIASPSSSPHLDFCIKLIPGGIGSTFFSKLEVGANVEIGDPKGMFNLSNSELNYFIATGVGLAPIMSILEDLPKDAKAELLFGTRHESDLFWLDRLDNLVKNNTNFDYKITLSQPGESWKGNRGRVIEHLKINSSAHYYICGRVEMVKDVRKKLIEGGVNTKNIHFEIF